MSPSETLESFVMRQDPKFLLFFHCYCGDVSSCGVLKARWIIWRWRVQHMTWTSAKTATTCGSWNVSVQRSGCGFFNMWCLWCPLGRKTPTRLLEDNQRHKQDVDGIYEVRKSLSWFGDEFCMRIFFGACSSFSNFETPMKELDQKVYEKNFQALEEQGRWCAWTVVLGGLVFIPLPWPGFFEISEKHECCTSIWGSRAFFPWAECHMWTKNLSIIHNPCHFHSTYCFIFLFVCHMPFFRLAARTMWPNLPVALWSSVRFGRIEGNAKFQWNAGRSVNSWNVNLVNFLEMLNGSI